MTTVRPLDPHPSGTETDTGTSGLDQSLAGSVPVPLTPPHGPRPDALGITDTAEGEGLGDSEATTRKPPSRTFGRVASWSALIMSPSVIALMALIFLDLIDAGLAIALGLSIWALTCILLSLIVSDLITAFRFADNLVINPEEKRPSLRLPGLAEWGLDAIELLDRKHRRRSAALERQLATSERTLDRCPDPLLLLNNRSSVVFANASARALFGKDPSGAEVSAVLRDPVVLSMLEKVVEQGQSASAQTKLSSDGGRELELHAAALPEGKAGGPVAIVSFHDITALKKLEHMRADFVANASHELRTPLASLIGFTETLATSAKDDPKARERFLGIMLEQAHRMQRLIEDLLSLSRIELAEHSVPDQSVDLGDVVRKVIDGLELRAQNKAMRLICRQLTTPTLVLGDPDQLAQVVQNLTDNAIKYGWDGSDVELSISGVIRGPAAMPARWRGRCVMLSVKDQGEGIAPEHLGRLTERFYRVDKARSRAIGGTGLGLAIVKHVVKRHRGAMDVSSVQGQGSIFSIYLPVPPV